MLYGESREEAGERARVRSGRREVGWLSRRCNCVYRFVCSSRCDPVIRACEPSSLALSLALPGAKGAIKFFALGADVNLIRRHGTRGARNIRAQGRLFALS